MAKLTKFRVIREHEGDRFYAVGDTRTAVAAEVKHLVPNVLEEVGPAETEAETETDEGESPSPKPVTTLKGKRK